MSKYYMAVSVVLTVRVIILLLFLLYDYTIVLSHSLLFDYIRQNDMDMGHL